MWYFVVRSTVKSTPNARGAKPPKLWLQPLRAIARCGARSGGKCVWYFVVRSTVKSTPNARGAKPPKLWLQPLRAIARCGAEPPRLTDKPQTNDTVLQDMHTRHALCIRCRIIISGWVGVYHWIIGDYVCAFFLVGKADEYGGCRI